MRELHDDEDVAEMYLIHKRKTDVLLWLYIITIDDNALDPPRKRAHTDDPLPTSTKRQLLKYSAQ